ncbi:hypothetical protein PPM_2712 [Paenibacillus polymyxa M1]|nr:hypothetical protein PPM_2712 [Paenibacillus polymyxa M1]
MFVFKPMRFLKLKLSISILLKGCGKTMFKKMVLLIIAASFLLIVTLPDQAFNHHHSIQPNVTIGGF